MTAGCQVSRLAETVTLTEPGRKPYTLQSVGGPQCLSGTGRSIWQHYQQVSQPPKPAARYGSGRFSR